MAVGVRLEFEGATQDQYDATYRRSIEADMPAGLILHSAGPIEDGWGVIDFWESREAFDRFAEKRLRPGGAHRVDSSVTSRATTRCINPMRDCARAGTGRSLGGRKGGNGRSRRGCDRIRGDRGHRWHSRRELDLIVTRGLLLAAAPRRQGTGRRSGSA